MLKQNLKNYTKIRQYFPNNPTEKLIVYSSNNNFIFWVMFVIIPDQEMGH